MQAIETESDAHTAPRKRVIVSMGDRQEEDSDAAATKGVSLFGRARRTTDQT
jgi:hypothetical protein